MKIYNKIVLNIDTMEVLEDDSYEYDGAVAECKGGGTTTVTNSVDKEYNARMAAVAEAQQAMAEHQQVQADEYFNYWETTYKPYEEQMIAGNLEVLPFEVAAQKETLKGVAELAPIETEYRKEFLESEMDLIPQRTAVTSKFYEQALSGINIQSRMNTAGADVAQSLAGASSAARRSAARMGLNVTSGKFADMLQTTSLDRARAVGLAKTTARISSEAEQFNRLAAADQSAGLDRRASLSAG